MNVPTKAVVIDSFPTPTIDEIKIFESRNSIVFPEEYVTFLRVSNGGSFNGGTALVGLPNAAIFAIVLLYGLNVPFGYWDLQKALNNIKILYPDLGNFLPIGRDPYGNEFCLRVSHRKLSDVWLLDHETGEFDSKQANSFDEFLSNIFQDPGRFQEKSQLCRIVEEGRVEELKSCLSKNAINFNEISKNGHNLLTLAAHCKQPEICRLLIEAGFNVNRKDSDGFTALHLTTSVDIIKILIESGADVEAKSNNGETPFLYHMKYCYERSAIELLKFGAHFDCIDSERLKCCPYVAQFIEKL